MRSSISACLCLLLAMSADLASAADAQGIGGTGAATRSNPWEQQSKHYIVQAATTRAARREIERVGAVPGKELNIIGAVATNLTSLQLTRLKARGNAQIYPDREVGPESNVVTIENPVLAT